MVNVYRHPSYHLPGATEPKQHVLLPVHHHRHHHHTHGAPSACLLQPELQTNFSPSPRVAPEVDKAQIVGHPRFQTAPCIAQNHVEAAWVLPADHREKHASSSLNQSSVEAVGTMAAILGLYGRLTTTMAVVDERSSSLEISLRV